MIEIIMGDVLRRYANPERVVQAVMPFDSYIESAWNMPTRLKGCEVTAHELAKEYGPEIEAWYLDILRSRGLLQDDRLIRRLNSLKKVDQLGHQSDCDLEPVSDDEFWDARESLELEVQLCK